MDGHMLIRDTHFFIWLANNENPYRLSSILEYLGELGFDPYEQTLTKETVHWLQNIYNHWAWHKYRRPYNEATREN